MDPFRWQGTDIECAVAGAPDLHPMDVRIPDGDIPLKDFLWMLLIDVQGVDLVHDQVITIPERPDPEVQGGLELVLAEIMMLTGAQLHLEQGTHLMSVVQFTFFYRGCMEGFVERYDGEIAREGFIITGECCPNDAFR
ncbi:MAG TPA: hypothetical protein VGE21_15235 [Flavobacteriales bacterium]